MWHKLRSHWGTVGFLLLLALFGEALGWKTLLMILFAAAVHELGHLAALKLLGISEVVLRISPFGAVLWTENLRLSYSRELLAVMAGPGVNLLCGSMLNILASVHPEAAAFAGAHWTLGLFNLMPAAPLDGWRILQLLLCWLLGPAAGDRAADVIGGTAALFLAGGIAFLMHFSGGNLWLLPSAAGLASAGIRTLTNHGYKGKSFKKVRFS